MQGALVPHWHAPLAQLSALLTLHEAQTPPGIAQLVTLNWRHALPWQQPFAHDMASHTQWPFMQRVPAKQAAPLLPQEHAPSRQVSERATLQAVQAPPVRLHVASVMGWQ